MVRHCHDFSTRYLQKIPGLFSTIVAKIKRGRWSLSIHVSHVSGTKLSIAHHASPVIVSDRLLPATTQSQCSTARYPPRSLCPPTTEVQCAPRPSITSASQGEKIWHGSVSFALYVYHVPRTCAPLLCHGVTYTLLLLLLLLSSSGPPLSRRHSPKRRKKQERSSDQKRFAAHTRRAATAVVTTPIRTSRTLSSKSPPPSDSSRSPVSEIGAQRSTVTVHSYGDQVKG